MRSDLVWTPRHVERVLSPFAQKGRKEVRENRVCGISINPEQLSTVLVTEGQELLDIIRLYISNVYKYLYV